MTPHRVAATRELAEVNARLHGLAEQLAQFESNGRPKRRRVRAIHACRDADVRALLDLAERAASVVEQLSGDLEEPPF